MPLNESTVARSTTSAKPAATRCRSCGESLDHTFVDLGMSPLCESYLTADQLNRMEPFYPLHVFVCTACYLVQLEEYVSPNAIFSEYAYFSSYADSWVEHARRYAEQMAERFALTPTSQIVELASNDGYLLQHFLSRGFPVLGIEPAENVAKVAIAKGIATVVRFFSTATARELVASGVKADLLLGNNVLAQVPDLNDFIAGMKLLLAPEGTITMEFPHLMRLVEGVQFDTIYHEHFSYFSLVTVERAFAAHGLTLFDVEELPTHGGSLRIYARHADNQSPPTDRLRDLRAREMTGGIQTLEYYAAFNERVKGVKRQLLSFLNDCKTRGKSVVGYGAPGKGNTLLNYCGIRTDYLDYTVDRNPYKHGKFTPGTHIPIFPPERIQETKPDFVLILPWNFKDEIMSQMHHIREWGGRFVVPIPSVTVI